MVGNVTSRIPVEIWHEVILQLIYGLDVFRPDPYELPPLIQMRHFFYLFDSQYREFRHAIFNIRAVCGSWNQFGQSLENEIVARNPKIGSHLLSEKDMNTVTKTLSRALRIDLSLPNGPPCYCRYYNKCHECMERLRNVLQYTPPTLHAVFDAEETFSARILGRGAIDEAEMEVLFCHPPPNLQALDLLLMDTPPPQSTLLNAISTKFTSLVYLGLGFVRPDVDMELRLDLPRLRSLRIESEFFESFTMDSCKLPQLNCLDVAMSDLDVDQLIGRLQHVGDHITYLKLSGEGMDVAIGGIGYQPNQGLQIWTLFPKLVALACPLELLIDCPPPHEHPLQYFKFVDYTTLCAEEVTKLPGLVANWPDCRGVAGAFPWRAVFKHLRRGEEYATTLFTTGMALSELGVTFEDEDGLSFVDAMQKFQGGDGHWPEELSRPNAFYRRGDVFSAFNWRE